MRAERLGALRRSTLPQLLADKTVLEAYAVGREYGRRRLDNRLQTAKREGFADGYEAGYDAAMKELRWRSA